VRAAKELLGGRLDRAQIKRTTGPVAAPEPIPAEAPAPEPIPTEAPAHEPTPAEVAASEPAPPEPSTGEPERPRKRILTKSEEQKRAARARAKLRKRASRQTA
jgi:hypothetical protein